MPKISTFDRNGGKVLMNLRRMSPPTIFPVVQQCSHCLSRQDRRTYLKVGLVSRSPINHETAKSSIALASSPSADFEARVAYLRQLYAGHPATASSQWSREYVASEIDPVNF